MKKQWWEERAERNKVTQAENQNNQDAPIPNMNPITATEALRIYVKKLKSELSAARKQEKEQREAITQKTAKLAEAHNELRRARATLEGLENIIKIYGLCNPDIQVARLSLEEALERRWHEIMQKNKEKSGMVTVEEEYIGWEMKQFIEKMIQSRQTKEEEQARQRLINQIREAATTNQQNQGESK